MVHRQKLQHALALFQRVRQRFGKALRRHALVFVMQAHKVAAPQLVLALQKRKENLFFCVKIIVDRRAGKRCLLADLFQRDVFETHGFVKRGAGVENLVLPGIRQFL